MIAACSALVACSLSVGNGSAFNPSNPSSDAGVPTGDDGSVPAFDSGSSGSDGGLGGEDAGFVPPPDAAADGGGADASPPAVSVRFLVVHASANLYDFRMCFGVAPPGGGSSTIVDDYASPDNPAQPVPFTNHLGVPTGGGVLLPSMSIAAGSQVTAYLVRQDALTGDVPSKSGARTCASIICSTGGCLSSAYYLAAKPFTFDGNATELLAIEGCIPPGAGVPAVTAAQCGSDYDASKGNLSVFASPLVGGAAGSPWSIQVAQLSPSYAAADGGPTLTYVDPTGDASVPFSVTSQLGVNAPVSVPLGSSDVTSAYFSLAGGITESLLGVQYNEAPATGPYAFFGQSTSYLVAVVGDATGANAPISLPDGGTNSAYNGYGLHVVAYPQTGP